MIVTTYNPNEFRAQGLFNHSIDNPSQAVSETISAPPVPPPAIATSVYADDGSPPDFEASTAGPARPTIDKAIIKAIRKASRTKQRKPPRPSSYSRNIPIKRPARARAVHSQNAHGGARKAGDDGDSGGDGPPGTAPTRFLMRPDGTARVEQDDGPDYIVAVEFATINEAVIPSRFRSLGEGKRDVDRSLAS